MLFSSPSRDHSLKFVYKTYTTTPEGAVLISYKTLITAPSSLAPAIERAFGSEPDCLGILVVTDLPAEYPAKRERLLRLAAAFAALPEDVREKYSDESTRYSFGWSWGKEIMNGKPGEYINNSLNCIDLYVSRYTQRIILCQPGRRRPRRRSGRKSCSPRVLRKEHLA